MTAYPGESPMFNAYAVSRIGTQGLLVRGASMTPHAPPPGLYETGTEMFFGMSTFRKNMLPSKKLIWTTSFA